MQPNHELLLSNEKELTIETWDNMGKSQMNSWKNCDSKRCLAYDSISTAFLEWQNYRNGEQSSGCQGQKWGREVWRDVGVTKKVHKSTWGTPLVTGVL